MFLDRGMGLKILTMIHLQKCFILAKSEIKQISIPVVHANQLLSMNLVHINSLDFPPNIHNICTKPVQPHIL